MNTIENHDEQINSVSNPNAQDYCHSDSGREQVESNDLACEKEQSQDEKPEDKPRDFQKDEDHYKRLSFGSTRAKIRPLHLDSNDEARREHYRRFEKWENHYSKNDGVFIKNSDGEQVEYCWPPEAPLEVCLIEGQKVIDQTFLQPKSTIIELHKEKTNWGKQVWPPFKGGEENPTGKLLYWTNQDPFTVADLQIADAYLFIGGTGSGKTMMVNACLNWAWGIDFNDQMRFNLIHDELSQHGMKEFTGCSQTSRISSYHVRVKNKDFAEQERSIIIVDTPGFADVQHRDKEFQTALQDFLANTEFNIKGICFVTKAQENRGTDEFNYVITATLQVFGENVKENLHGICTHASQDETPNAQKLFNSKGIYSIHTFDNYTFFPGQNDKSPGKNKQRYLRRKEEDFEWNKEQMDEFFEASLAVSSLNMVQTRKVIKLKSIIENEKSLVSQMLIDSQNDIEQLNLVKDSIERHQLGAHNEESFKQEQEYTVKETVNVPEGQWASVCTYEGCQEICCKGCTHTWRGCSQTSGIVWKLCNHCGHPEFWHSYHDKYLKPKKVSKTVFAQEILEKYKIEGQTYKEKMNEFEKRIKEKQEKIDMGTQKIKLLIQKIEDFALLDLKSDKSVATYLQRQIENQTAKPGEMQDQVTTQKLKEQLDDLELENDIKQGTQYKVFDQKTVDTIEKATAAAQVVEEKILKNIIASEQDQKDISSETSNVPSLDGKTILPWCAIF